MSAAQKRDAASNKTAAAGEAVMTAGEEAARAAAGEAVRVADKEAKLFSLYNVLT